MNNLIEIRWHGRGGQGAKTASLLLADAAFNTGKYIQGFPEYGPERMGAPITAYNRISDKPITIHSNIYEPNYVVVVDDTLLESVPVTAGLKKEGAIVINTTKSSEYLKEKLNGYDGNIYTIDARKISIEALGKYFPNTPMLAAIVKVSNIMNEQEFLDDMIGSFKHKFAKKPEVIEGNMKALEIALKEIVKVKFHDGEDTFFKKYNSKDIKIIKNVEKEDDSIEADNPEDLKELQELEKLEKMDEKNKK